MSEEPQSALFPLPVRWFELPMNTARWGFMRLEDATKAKAQEPVRGHREDFSASSIEPESSSSSHLGTVLNERA